MRIRFGLAVIAVLGLVTTALVPTAGAQLSWSCDGQIATIVGTPGDDTLRGTPGADVIVAREGNDMIEGLGGDDVVCAGKGDDQIYGGDGFDIIFAAQGDDTIYAASGDSTAERVDTRGARMFGGAGNDTIHGSNRWDRMQGGLGVDTMFGYEGRDWMRAGGGKDFVDGGASIDDLHGGNDADVILLTDGDTVKGGAGVDECTIASGQPASSRSCENDPPLTVTPAPTPEPAPTPPVEPEPVPFAGPLGNVSVASCSASNETVQLENSGAEAITLSGWSLQDEGPEFTFELDNVTIQPNQTALLQFGTGATTPGAIRLSTRNIWNNDGDTAHLINATGAVVSTLSC